MQIFPIHCHIFKIIIFQTMAKGKHAPTKGAVREDKIIHPKSRKAAKLHNKEQRKLKMSGKVSVGGQRLQILGEKLLWFHENLNVVLQEEEMENVSVTAEDMLELIDAYILRNQDEKDQIKLKNSIGSGQFRKRNQHQIKQHKITGAHFPWVPQQPSSPGEPHPKQKSLFPLMTN